MKTFEVIVPVEEASGTQTYHIVARSLAEAKKIWASGDAGECVSEELEVVRVGEPEFTEIEP